MWFTDQTSYVKILFRFGAYSHIPTSGKELIVTPFVVQKISGEGVSIPLDAISGLKRPMPLSVKI